MHRSRTSSRICTTGSMSFPIIGRRSKRVSPLLEFLPQRSHEPSLDQEIHRQPVGFSAVLVAAGALDERDQVRNIDVERECSVWPNFSRRDDRAVRRRAGDEKWPPSTADNGTDVAHPSISVKARNG